MNSVDDMVYEIGSKDCAKLAIKTQKIVNVINYLTNFKKQMQIYISENFLRNGSNAESIFKDLAALIQIKIKMLIDKSYKVFGDIKVESDFRYRVGLDQFQQYIDVIIAISFMEIIEVDVTHHSYVFSINGDMHYDYIFKRNRHI